MYVVPAIFGKFLCKSENLIPRETNNRYPKTELIRLCLIAQLLAPMTHCLTDKIF